MEHFECFNSEGGKLEDVGERAETEDLVSIVPHGPPRPGQ